MKKLLALLLSCGLIFCFMAGCASNDTPPAEKIVKIGVFEPSSGDSGAGGKQETLGMQYANSLTPTVEIGGETYTVELAYSDNGSTAEKAPTAASSLVSQGVAVVLGSYGSTVSIAGSPVFKDAGIAAIGVTCTNPQVTEGNDHYFRICFIDPDQGTVQAKFATEKFEAKTAYCLAELGNEYDMGLVNYFQKAFKADGGEVVSDTFPKDNADFSTYLTNAKNAGADVIFAPCSIAYATQIIEQAAAQGLDIPLIAGDTWDSNKVVEAAQGKNLQIYVSTFYHEGGNPEFDQGLKDFINSNQTNKDNNGGNDMISAVSIMGYDAYYVALEAMKNADSVDPAAIKAALWNIEYTGASGKIVFNETGDAARDTAYIKTVDTANNSWILEREQGI